MYVKWWLYGNLSNLRYYSYALSGVQINDLVTAGPDLTPNDSMKIFPYYSLFVGSSKTTTCWSSIIT